MTNFKWDKLDDRSGDWTFLYSWLVVFFKRLSTTLFAQDLFYFYFRMNHMLGGNLSKQINPKILAFQNQVMFSDVLFSHLFWTEQERDEKILRNLWTLRRKCWNFFLKKQGLWFIFSINFMTNNLLRTLYNNNWLFDVLVHFFY